MDAPSAKYERLHALYSALSAKTNKSFIPHANLFAVVLNLTRLRLISLFPSYFKKVGLTIYKYNLLTHMIKLYIFQTLYTN